MNGSVWRDVGRYGNIIVKVVSREYVDVASVSKEGKWDNEILDKSGNHFN